MQQARIWARRSVDPCTQVGAVIATADNRPLGAGYNGMPRDSAADAFPWEKEGELHETKYAYVIHAEVNAILNTVHPPLLRGATLYCTLYPCNECAKQIAQVGVARIVYAERKSGLRSEYLAADRIFEACGVCVERAVAGADVET